MEGSTLSRPDACPRCAVALPPECAADLRRCPAVGCEDDSPIRRPPRPAEPVLPGRTRGARRRFDPLQAEAEVRARVREAEERRDFVLWLTKWTVLTVLVLVLGMVDPRLAVCLALFFVLPRRGRR